jgi:hypothetical protein
MQCQVAPFRLSNFGMVSATHMSEAVDRIHLPLDELSNILRHGLVEGLSSLLDDRKADLLDVVVTHCLLGCADHQRM